MQKQKLTKLDKKILRKKYPENLIDVYDLKWDFGISTEQAKYRIQKLSKLGYIAKRRFGKRFLYEKTQKGKNI